MNKKLQNLIFDLSSENITLVTALLYDQNQLSWENNKRILISTSPRLTLEMSINQTSPKEACTIPDPQTIYKALKYVQRFNSQSYLLLKTASNC